jgi:hypothetical protein
VTRVSRQELLHAMRSTFARLQPLCTSLACDVSTRGQKDLGGSGNISRDPASTCCVTNGVPYMGCNCLHASSGNRHVSSGFMTPVCRNV